MHIPDTVIASLYSTIVEGEGWRETIHDLTHAFSVSKIALWEVDSLSGCHSAVSLGWSKDLIARYRNSEWQHDPRIAAAFDPREGTAILDEGVDRFSAPGHRHILGRVEADDHRALLLQVNRPTALGDFSPEERHDFDTLCTHIGEAVHLRASVTRYLNGHPPDLLFDVRPLAATIENSSVADFCARHGLTPTQRSVLEQLATGLPPKSIAAALSKSVNVVRFHLKEIYERTGLHSQLKLLAALHAPLDEAYSGQVIILD